jgi:hypothetical protein
VTVDPRQLPALEQAAIVAELLPAEGLASLAEVAQRRSVLIDLLVQAQQERRELLAALWGAGQLLAVHRNAQAAAMVKAALPDDYEPAGKLS